MTRRGWAIVAAMLAADLLVLLGVLLLADGAA